MVSLLVVYWETNTCRLMSIQLPVAPSGLSLTWTSLHEYFHPIGLLWTKWTIECFIICNGRKVAKYEAGKWVPLLSGVVVRDTLDGIKIEMPH
jgi:hypothetical protein